MTHPKRLHWRRDLWSYRGLGIHVVGTPTDGRPIRPPLDHRVSRPPPARPPTGLPDPPARSGSPPGTHPRLSRPTRRRTMHTVPPHMTDPPQTPDTTDSADILPERAHLTCPPQPSTSKGLLTVGVNIREVSQMRCPKFWDTECSRKTAYSPSENSVPKNLGHRIRSQIGFECGTPGPHYG